MARPRKEEKQIRHPIAVLRKALGLTQKEMATLANCSEVTLYTIQSGKRARRFSWTSHKLHAGIDAMAQQLGVDDTLKEQLGLLNLEGHGGEKFMSTVNFIFKTHNEAFRKKAAPFEVKRKKPEAHQ